MDFLFSSMVPGVPAVFECVGASARETGDWSFLDAPCVLRPIIITDNRWNSWIAPLLSGFSLVRHADRYQH